MQMEKPKPRIIIPDDAELERRQAAHDLLAELQDARELRYDPESNAFHFLMRSGASCAIPVAMIREFADATREQLAEVRLVAGGSAIEHRALDMDMSVRGIIRDAFGLGGPKLV